MYTHIEVTATIYNKTMYLYRDLDITQEHVYIKKQSHRSKVRVAVVSYRGKYECMHVDNCVRFVRSGCHVTVRRMRTTTAMLLQARIG